MTTEPDPALHLISTVIHDLRDSLELVRLPALDLEDVKTVMRDDGGRAVVGVGVASGPNRLEDALMAALRAATAQIERDPPDDGTPP